MVLAACSRAPTGATLALVGHRAQLPAVGRGGALDMAAQIRGRTYAMTELQRFTDPNYAALTLDTRDRDNPGAVFARLAATGLVTLHDGDDAAREPITAPAPARTGPASGQVTGPGPAGGGRRANRGVIKLAWGRPEPQPQATLITRPPPPPGPAVAIGGSDRPV
ncbi:MAG: AAA family ATPase [Bifidobacteriaceae bacterium]|jgi:hypothetical protein|nr:AAA family ATPase [Bifidobacteriaceae bacterium]